MSKEIERSDIEPTDVDPEEIAASAQGEEGAGSQLPRMASRFPYPGQPERREFILKMTLYGAGVAAAYSSPEVAMAQGGGPLSPGSITLSLTGTGVITSVCGTTTLAFNSTITYTPAGSAITFESVSHTGTLVSGYDIGTVQVSSSAPFTGTIAGSTYNASGQLLYSDNFNSSLVVPASFSGTIDSAGTILTLNHSGTGSGFCPSTGVLAIQVAF